MAALRRLSRLAMIPLAPALIVQGTRLRRDTPRLPDAAQPWSGSIAGPDPGAAPLHNPLRLLVLGDSTAAGVGVDHQDDGLPGNLARELSTLLARDVQWRAIGENGATARDLLERHLEAATADSFDLVFLSIGANDALGLRARGAFARDIRSLLSALRATSPEAPLIMSSLPAFSRFELLPNPLRWNLYLHSRSLEDAARAVIARTPNAIMSPPPPPYTEGFFATDLFHPSAIGYRDWAQFAIEDAAAAGLLSSLALAAGPRSPRG